MKEKAYKQALDFRPDILIIKLGTNDTNPIFWKYKNEYPVDMLTMIRSFKQVSPTVKNISLLSGNHQWQKIQ